MRDRVTSYVREMVARYRFDDSVLDTCAGWNPNAIRAVFPGKQYLTQDFVAYEGTDYVCDVIDMKCIGNESIGLVLNLESMEHIAWPQKAMDEIYRVLKPGGGDIDYGDELSHPSLPEGLLAFLSRWDRTALGQVQDSGYDLGAEPNPSKWYLGNCQEALASRIGGREPLPCQSMESLWGKGMAGSNVGAL